MKRIVTAILIGCFLAVNFTGVALADGVAVTTGVPAGNAFIPRGTLIDAELISTVNSGDNWVRDFAYFRIRQNILVNGVVVLPRGTVGAAQVTVAEPASFLGKRGRLELQVRHIQALNGALIPVTLDIKKYGGPMDKDLPFLLLSLYTFNAHKLGKLYPAYRGGEAELPAGMNFQLAVDDDADLECTPERLAVVMVKKL